MLLYERKLTPDNVVNLPRNLKFFQNEIWTLQYKMAVMRLFRIKIKSKKVILGDEFIEVIQYDKPIYKYDKNELYREFKALQVGQVNWYSYLSNSARYFVRNIDNILFSQLYNRVYDHDYFKRIDERYNRLYQYALDNQRYELLDDDLKSLKNDIFEKNIVLGETLKNDYYQKYKRLLDYAFNYDESLLNNSKDDLSDVTILNYLLLDQPIPTTIVDKIRRSCSRSYENIINYARTNIDKFQLFVTLTFAEKEQKEIHDYYNLTRYEDEYNLKFDYVDNTKDYEECIKKFSNFRDNLQKQLKKQGVNLFYLGVPEYQENGNIHFHLLMNEIPSDFLYDVPAWLDYDYNINDRRYGKGLKTWKHGKSDVEKIKDKSKIINYLAQYLPKSIKNVSETEYIDRLNKKRFYKSNNLIKPKEIINEDFNEEYEDIYYTEYQNLFNQSQTKKILFKLSY